MLQLGNTTCAAQIAAQPKSSVPFYEKLSIYVSVRVSDPIQFSRFLDLDNFRIEFLILDHCAFQEMCRDGKVLGLDALQYLTSYPLPPKFGSYNRSAYQIKIEKLMNFNKYLKIIHNNNLIFNQA